MTAADPSPAGGAPNDVGAGPGDVSRIIRRSQDAAHAYHKGALRLPPPMRIHELIEGAGTVHHAGRLLGAVSYWLKDVEEDDKTVFPTGHQELGEPSDARTGSRGLFGFIRGETKENVLGPYIGTPLALRTADGRELEFTVTKVLTPDGALFPNYLVQGVAPAR